MDSAGNMYIAGNTVGFPLVHPFQSGTCGDGSDEWNIVAKLDPSGRIVFSSCFFRKVPGMAESRQYAIALALDGAGNVTVATATDAPNLRVLHALQPRKAARQYGFLAKFGPRGGLLYATYLTGGVGNRLALDPAGNALVYLGTRPQGVRTANLLPGKPCSRDKQGYPPVYLARISVRGDRMLSSTCLPNGYGGEETMVDRRGNIYMTAGDGHGRAFLTKLDPSARNMLVHVGFAALGSGGASTIDGSGNVYLSGAIPTVHRCEDQTEQGSHACTDATASGLDPRGRTRFYMSFGGSRDTWGNAIAVDQQGNSWIVGATSSSDFPTTRNALQRTNQRAILPGTINGSSPVDAFLAEIGTGTK